MTSAPTTPATDTAENTDTADTAALPGDRAGTYRVTDPLDTDYYGVFADIGGAERDAWSRARVLISEYGDRSAAQWDAGEYDVSIVRRMGELDLFVDGIEHEGLTALSPLAAGLVNMEISRGDGSLGTVLAVQGGLALRTLALFGSDAQKAQYLQPIARGEVLGSFALTEPDHGSDIAGGLSTTARRDGDAWVIDGTKTWIGGAAASDLLVVFARDVADSAVKAFLVPTDAPGVGLEAITGKISLRPMQNARITLDGVQVAEADRLQRVDGWRDVARILRAMRSDVAWIAAGLQAGVLDAAVRYTRERRQFDRPLSGFQLVQEKLARMLGNTVAALALVVELSAHQDDSGAFADENSALAKMQTARLARETVALGREVLGGNGILLAHDAARFFADAEAVYSYEGTHEINALIVGRALTGASAFT